MICDVGQLADVYLLHHAGASDYLPLPRALAVRAVLRFPLSTLSYVRRGNLRRVRLHTRAYASFVTLLPHALAERRRIRRRRAVEDDEILAMLTPR